MPAAYSLVRTPAQAGFALRPPVLVAGVLFHHWSRPARLHLPVWRPAPLARASDAVQYSSTRRLTLLLVQRSEERRVGKECRCRWSPEHVDKRRAWPELVRMVRTVSGV